MAYKFSHEYQFVITTRSDGPPGFPESFPTLSETFFFSSTFPPHLSTYHPLSSPRGLSVYTYLTTFGELFRENGRGKLSPLPPSLFRRAGRQGVPVAHGAMI